MPAVKNFIDETVFKQLKTLGISSVGGVRRRNLHPPHVDRHRRPTADRRRDPAFLWPIRMRTSGLNWIDGLLASDGYADYFATKWTSVLRGSKRIMPSYEHGDFLFHDWIRQSLYDNKPYDQFARDILTASGEVSENPAVAWYREAAAPSQEMEDTAQLFLGMRIQCAHCHHHPFERWSQQDYFGFDAFFSRVGKKKGLAASEFRIYHRRGLASAENIRTHEKVSPAPLGGKTGCSFAGPRSPASAGRLDGRSQEPVLRSARRPTAIGSTSWAAKRLSSRKTICGPRIRRRILSCWQRWRSISSASKYDLKDMVRTICNSQVYQLSAVPNKFNAGDRQSYSHYYPKRLTAEVLLDAVDQVTGTPSKFNGMPMGTRAVELPDSGFNSYFLTVFGRPEGSSACECERSNDANLAQSLHLLNSNDVQQKVGAGSGRAASLADDKKHTPEQKIDQVYMEFYSRHPAPEEAALSLAHIAKTKNDHAAYEDILWALINTKEFLFNH